MDIIPIGSTHIDWQAYMSFCKEVNGHSPTRKLDQSDTKLIEQLAFVVSLSELANKDHTPVNALKNCQVFMDYISLSFIFYKSNLDSHGNLHKFEFLNQIILLSGTLREWKDTIIVSLIPQAKKEHREAYGKVLLYMEINGYRLLFNNYKKIMQEDGTFILENK